MNQEQFIFHEVNTVGAVLLAVYMFFFISFCSVTTFMTLQVYKNVEKFRAATRINRQLYFFIYLLLNLTNLPFGFFVSTVFTKLKQHAQTHASSIFQDYPVYDLASLAVLMGMASHILFAAFWVLAWMHVEAGPASKVR